MFLLKTFLLTLMMGQLQALEGDPMRLDLSLIPKSYNLHLIFDQNFLESQQYSGKVVINFITTKSNITSIKLHKSYAIDIQTSDIILKNNKILTTNYNPTSEIFEIKLQTPLEDNELHSLIIKNFGSILYPDMYGISSKTYTEKGKTELLVNSQNQPSFARRTFPCFDEPKFKATFQLAITHPKTYTALSNQGIIRKYDLLDLDDHGHYTESNLLLSVFNTTEVMSTYLFHIFISKFTSLSYHATDGHVYRFWARDSTINLAQYALEITPKILDYYKDFTGVSYWSTNADKLDQVAYSDLNVDSVENWGLINHRELDVFYHPQETTLKRRQEIAIILSHEISHTWFGNLVTLDWWSDMWLNEGFARYFSSRGANIINSDWELENQFIVDTCQLALLTDSESTSRPLSSEVSTVPEILSTFNDLTYAKGACFLRMIEHALTDEFFITSMQGYIKNNLRKNVAPRDLWVSLKSPHLPRSAEEIFDHWIRQPGYPMVTARIDNGVVILNQKRFTFDGTSFDTKWDIPISYTTSKNPDWNATETAEWLNRNDTNKVLTKLADNEWILINIQIAGLYRVMYDQNLLERLVKTLEMNPKNFDSIPKAQIVDDSFNFARAGLIEYDEAFSTTIFLRNDEDYYAWSSALRVYSFLIQRLPEGSTQGKLKEYIRKQLVTVYKTASFDPQVTRPYISRLRNFKILDAACSFNHQYCVRDALKMFRNFIDRRIRIDVNLRQTVLCTGLKYSNRTRDWDYLWQVYKTTIVPSAQEILINSLACTNNIRILERYLGYTIDPRSGYPTHDGFIVFQAVVNSGPIGRRAAFNFLKKNFLKIREQYEILAGLDNCITALGDSFNTEEEIIEFADFVEKNRDLLGDNADDGDNAIQSARENLNWALKYGPGINRALIKHS